jgi:hypothetical protein
MWKQYLSQPQKEASSSQQYISANTQNSIHPHPALQLQASIGNRGTSQFVEAQHATTIEPNQDRPVFQGLSHELMRDLQSSDNARQQDQEKRTGLPDKLKAGIEAISGIDLDDVKVHHNSSKPSEIKALAYTKGTEIYVGPGQAKYLPHEAWHVVQQKQGRVQPKIHMKGGVTVNDDQELEHEADVMGAKALAPEAQFCGSKEDGVQAEVKNAGTIQLARRRRHSKPPSLPGRQKRLKQRQEEDLLNNLNNLGPSTDDHNENEGLEKDRTANYWDILKEEANEQPLETVKPTTVSIKELLKKGDSSELVQALKAKYSDGLGGQMIREMRMSKITMNEATLKQKAQKKIRERDKQHSGENKPTSIASGRLNVKTGGPVSGLTKGTGGGYLAGEGGRWHVHYDHVKFGNSKSTRINFTGKKRQDILTGFLSSSPQPPIGSENRASWDACYQWMQKNLK